MAVAIPVTSTMEARLGSNVMRHFWRQSSDSVDLDHAPTLDCLVSVTARSVARRKRAKTYRVRIVMRGADKQDRAAAARPDGLALGHGAQTKGGIE